MSTAAPLRATLSPWVLGSVLVSVVVLVVVLLSGGGAPQPAPGGLPDAGPLTGWGLPVVRLLADLAGIVTVGLTLVASRMIHVSTAAADQALPAAGRAGAVWAVLCVLQALLFVSETRASPLLDPAALPGLLAALRDSPDATALLSQAALAATVVWFAGLSRGSPGATITLGLAVAAFLPQTLIGHAATGDRLLGTTTLALHVAASALWIGGLAALAWATLRAGVPLADAVPRYSVLALWCVGVVVASGVANAALRVHSLGDVLGTTYGLVLVAKFAAVVVLVGFGWLHRQHTVEMLSRWRRRKRVPAAAPVFIALAAVELAVMAATVALAVGLARTPPPADSGDQPDAVAAFAVART